MDSRLWIEAGIVGACLAAALAIVAWLRPDLLRTPTSAAWVGLALGAAFHLAFEATGLNATYCRTGHACTV